MEEASNPVKFVRRTAREKKKRVMGTKPEDKLTTTVKLILGLVYVLYIFMNICLASSLYYLNIYLFLYLSFISIFVFYLWCSCGPAVFQSSYFLLRLCFSLLKLSEVLTLSFGGDSTITVIIIIIISSSSSPSLLLRKKEDKYELIPDDKFEDSTRVLYVVFVVVVVVAAFVIIVVAVYLRVFDGLNACLLAGAFVYFHLVASG